MEKYHDLEKEENFSIIDGNKGNRKEAKVIDFHEKKKEKLEDYLNYLINPHEIFKIGESFFEDYENGIQHFGLATTGSLKCKQRVLLELANFFHRQNSQLKIAIPTLSLATGIYSNLLSDCKRSEKILTASSSITEINFCGQFDFLSLGEILDQREGKVGKDWKNFWDRALFDYDVVLWDIPSIHEFRDSLHNLDPLLSSLENVSIIVEHQVSSIRDVDRVKNFFIGHGIDIKGLLFDPVKI